MIHLGDITKIDWPAAEPVDCVVGGSPCQDLSQAGKRAGLAGERSGLYMDQINGVKELRKADVLRGRTGQFIRPRYMVWENVRGAFSSNGGKDFSAVLTEAVRIVEPDAPDVPVPEKGWNYSGVLMGDGWSIAWRTHDAKYWGVPQRRGRISIVCDFGGHTASEILFECKGVSGNPAQVAEEREKAAGNSGMGVDRAVTCQDHHGDAGEREGSPTSCISDVGKIYALASSSANAELAENDVSPTLLARAGTGGNQQPIIFVAGFKHRQGSGAGSIGFEKEKSPTLCSEQMPAVLVINDQGGSVMDVQDNVVATLGAQSHGHEPLVFSIENHPNDSRCKLANDDICQSLTSRMGTGGGNVPMVLCAKPYQETTGPIMANSHPGSYTGQDAYNDMLIVNGIDLANMVRRLTPLECERLQGFPDGWTDIGEWVDSKGKTRKCSDSMRYKALGNSIALPFWRFLIKRISAQYVYTPKLGSLFDGIGGFPKVWEEFNGAGTAVWASEIEEFPIAVTKNRFGGNHGKA